MTKPMRSGNARRKWAVAVAATGLALASNLAVTTSSNAAAQVSCSGWTWGNFDAGAGYSTGTYKLKDGPYQECTNAGQTYAGTYLYYHCYITNDYGNTWTHARISGTSIQGWISDANLTLNDDGTRGAIEKC